MRSLKYKILWALFLISLVASFMLAVSSRSATEFCDVNSDDGCGIVYNSKYAEVFGIKNCHLGVVIYAFLLFLAYRQIKYPSRGGRFIINWACVVGAVIALYFLYLQQFVLLEYCRYCLVADASALAALGVVLWKWRY